MDFLELPDGAEVDDVPDLAGPEYDNGDFLTYPERRGLHFAALLKGDLVAVYKRWKETTLTYPGGGFDPERLYGEIGHEIARSTVGEVVQTWLVFGMLSVALRRPVLRREGSVTKEVTGSDGEKTQQRTIRLRDLVAEFAFSVADNIRSDPEWASHLKDCLRQASICLDALQQHLPAPLRRAILPREVELSLYLLLNTIDHHQRLWSESHEGSQFDYTSFENELRERRGWCPQMIAQYSGESGIQSLYYASLLPGMETMQGHDMCTDDTCVAYNINPAEYRALHSPACLCGDRECDHSGPSCPCQNLVIPKDKFQEFFDADGYPLVRLRRNEVELVRYKPGVSYVAISHVWSDGRGNPRQNALPICQLESLQHWVEASMADNEDEDPPLFWIDTLCVPLQEPLRNTAIMRMAQVYNSATYVLVLCGELVSQPLPQPGLQALYAIQCSKWSRRLWTMQEAALARELRFQFADQVVEYSRLYSQIARSNSFVNDRMQSQVSASFVNLHMHGLFGRSSIEKGAKRLSFLQLVLSWRNRSTSRASDAAICGSILTGTDLGRVLAVPDDAKMQAFWSCQRDIPVSVLWANGPRLEVSGLRWAPQDLLHPATRTSFLPGDHLEGEPGLVTDWGLLCRDKPAILLENPSQPLTEHRKLDWPLAFCFQSPSTHDWYMFTPEFDDWLDLEHLLENEYILMLEEFDPKHRKQPGCLLLRENAEVLFRAQTEGIEVPILVRYLLPGVVYLLDYLDLSSTDTADLAHVQVGKVFDGSQSWLIT